MEETADVAKEDRIHLFDQAEQAYKVPAAELKPTKSAESRKNLENSIKNNTFAKNIYGKYKGLPQRLHPEAEEVRRTRNGESVLLEASVVAERSIGLAQEKQGEVTPKESRKIQEQAIVSFAKENGLWYENLEKDVDYANYLSRGNENRAYLSSDKKVIKFNNSLNYASPIDFMDSMTIWNSLFPEAAYELIGFGPQESGVSKTLQGGISYIIKQNYIPLPESSVSEKALKDDLKQRGFDIPEGKINRYKGVYHPVYDIWLRDLHEGNVKVASDGSPVYIDGIIDTLDVNKGLGGTKEIPLTDYLSQDAEAVKLETTKDTQKVFTEATDLFYKIKNTDGAAKRKALADERKALMNENPSVKFIDDNIKNVLDQLEAKEVATRKGNCP
jgi:hypothetical protein